MFLFAACSNTSIVSSWKAPDATVTDGEFKKVMLAILVKDEATRRYSEDRMAAKNEAFYPSYNIFESKEIMDNQEYCKKALEAQGFDGIVTMQLVAVDQQQNYVPGSYSGAGYWGYHGAYYSSYYSPGYYTTDTKYVIATNIFSLKDNKLLWSGVTSTVNPTSIDQTLEEITHEVRAQMVKDKLIVATPKAQ